MSTTTPLSDCQGSGILGGGGAEINSMRNAIPMRSEIMFECLDLTYGLHVFSIIFGCNKKHLLLVTKKSTRPDTSLSKLHSFLTLKCHDIIFVIHYIYVHN